jgi:hypothetical protein
MHRRTESLAVRTRPPRHVQYMLFVVRCPVVTASDSTRDSISQVGASPLLLIVVLTDARRLR